MKYISKYKISCQLNKYVNISGGPGKRLEKSKKPTLKEVSSDTGIMLRVLQKWAYGRVKQYDANVLAALIGYLRLKSVDDLLVVEPSDDEEVEE